jgi:hypothetical protein
MKRTLHFGALALVALLAAGPAARAETIAYHYNWEPSHPAVFSDDGSGKITFTDESLKPATNGTFVDASNLQIVSSAGPDHLEHLTKNGGYVLTLTLTDDATGKTGVVSFTGKLSGSFGAGSSNVTNAITSKLIETVTIGKHVYTVSFYSYSPPSPTGARNVGSITFRVDVGNAAPGGSGTPEPASLVLSLLGASFAGVWRLRRKPGGAAVVQS